LHWECRQLNLSIDFLPGNSKISATLDMTLSSAMGITSPAAILVLAASLLLGACAATDTGKRDDPVFFGGGSGANGAGGATSGMSFSW
jgi:hypothetical protein